jgi:hypothetical protein
VGGGFSTTQGIIDYWVIFGLCTVAMIASVFVLIKVKVSQSWRLPLCILVLGLFIYPLSTITISRNIIIQTSNVDYTVLDRSVYVVIFDRYCRNDILQKYFDYDNTLFLDELKVRGFQVANESMANYAQTSPSTASMMNMQYLDVLFPDATEDTQGYVPINKAFTSNVIKRTVGNQWYNIDSWFKGTQDTNYLLGEYATNLINSTVLQPAVYYYNNWQRGKYNKGETIENVGGGLTLYTEEWASYLVRYQFGLLNKEVAPSQPMFLFAHIISPHPPYVFDENGDNPNLNQSLEKLYVGQLKYINKLILGWLDKLIKYNPDAVVIILSDEGMRFADSAYNGIRASKTITEEQEMEVHSANLLVARNIDIYSTVTPVNVMRIMSNKCLGTELELLEDKSYIIPDSNFPYRWIRVR